jgi:hypothetical protein
MAQVVKHLPSECEAPSSNTTTVKKKKKKKIKKKSWAPMAYTCDPSYSGGRDQEDHSSKPGQANSSTRPYLEKNLHKKGLVE